MTTIATTDKILTGKKFPFCPGCGHGISVNQLAAVLKDLGYKPKDVVIISDIGCSGLIDPLFNTHTIHGLHGRSPALGLGVAMGLNQKKGKKTIAFIGDGGATIGLQHILEDARRNVNMTLILLNNLLYGMTGGQISGLSTPKFKEIIDFEKDIPAFDVVKLAYASGARYAVRVNNPKNIKTYLKKAIETDGFSLIEIASLCTSYAFKKLPDFLAVTEEEEEFENERPATEIIPRETRSLFDKQAFVEPAFSNNISQREGFLIAGSAGGGVQSVGKFLAQAGMLSGLHATMKGEYPITVGTGFSVAEVIMDKNPINYTGLDNPDLAVIVTEDGLEKVKDRIRPETKVYLDEKLNGKVELPARETVVKPFSSLVNRKSLALLATAYMLKRENLIPVDALIRILSEHRLRDIFMETIDRMEQLD